MTQSTTVHPQPHLTHEVLNQSQPRVDVNEYELNTVCLLYTSDAADE